MQFAPAIDRRLVVRVGREADLRSSAEVWRRLRRVAIRFDVATPCYESVRKLANAERERRAELVATIATVMEVATRRVPVLPEQVPPIYRRKLAESRARLHLRRRGPP